MVDDLSDGDEGRERVADDGKFECAVEALRKSGEFEGKCGHFVPTMGSEATCDGAGGEDGNGEGAVFSEIGRAHV